MNKRGFVKSPHGKLYKDYGGDLMIILSFLGKKDTLNTLILVYYHAEDERYGKKFGVHIKKGSSITKYNSSKYSLLEHLKRIGNKKLTKVVKKDLRPLWITEKMEN